MGENGAGKSTLLKVLSGVNTPKAGTITVDGQVATLRSAAPPMRSSAGIAIIYQELHLVPGLSAAENLHAGAAAASHGADRPAQALRAKAEAVLRDLGEDIDPSMPVGRLSIGQRQMVEIGKALLRDARIIAFDEPTSSLSARARSRTSSASSGACATRVKRDHLRHPSHGRAVRDLCDAVTVFRDGACESRASCRASLRRHARGSLVTEMVGRAIEDIYGYHRAAASAMCCSEVERTVTGPGLDRAGLDFDRAAPARSSASSAWSVRDAPS